MENNRNHIRTSVTEVNDSKDWLNFKAAWICTLKSEGDDRRDCLYTDRDVFNSFSRNKQRL